MKSPALAASVSLFCVFSLLASWLLVGCGTATPPTTPTGTVVLSTSTAQPVASPGGVTATPMPAMTPMEQQASTASYKLRLRLGPPEKMLSPGEAKGVASGEVMVNGEMGMGSMGGMAPNYHLEVQVTDVKSGAVITDKSVDIQLTNVATKEITPVQVAAMYGVQEGPSDTHFGNNVALTPGNYIIKVDVYNNKVNIVAETARFKVTIP